MKIKHYLVITILALLLAACGQVGDPVDHLAPTEPIEETAQAAAPTAVPATSQPEQNTEESEDFSEQAAAASPSRAESDVVDEAPNITPPTLTAALVPIESAPGPIEVTYLTPGQGEGPYYTIDKPEDHDSDLTAVNGASGIAAGEVIEFGGKVYDAAGIPAEGIVIEIWQTDTNGVYLHPADPNTDQRDRNFQFYGESITDIYGSYSFRTVLPGRYEPRPRHIHIKVRLEGKELLTTQFYFEGDPELTAEAMFNQAGSDGVHLIISLKEGQDSNGRSIFTGQRDIILNADLSG